MSSVQKQKVTKLNSNYVSQQENKQQTQQIKRRKLKRRLLGIGFCAVIFAIVIVTTLITQSANIEQRLNTKAELEANLEELEKQEKILREEIVKLNDEEYIGKIARDEYFLSEEGEVIFKIPE